MPGKILLLNGPNLNMLGKAEPDIYGHDTLEDVVALATAEAAKHGLEVEALQSNHEGELIDALHNARGTHIGCVINPGGLTHTSVALLDAVKASELPTVEVHISNPHAREEFRHHSYISLAAVSVIAGAGIQGYRFAVDILANLKKLEHHHHHH
uniref:3-dehydroquinate dehydratase n=1 Tax=Corynebacterium glutamicum (strain ATCC 13032 / DSM 20300 / JCM 1318 / BCRC 11384 / CCUG 27702 / LMG 3730 / NBRC 12168 / NCIMB 10025 / NRRL B-2784 / 534) TaxID=196627 RepID=UPI002AE0B30C|nr:Chain A, 3-dehydroquinate dehydratase [Corynebacterium glutamicum ATCC 13032]8IDU_B Chain B, 3-dehydroquinate dehydratase [Corynebacterium glutamicum ATCC 13032]8IDU_C Chain C, 3-dehydroquinate dehydratase [Corynebacterium glutamicum ATCC 13032]8IDU_D Chain D, 3-dehydroquinate dehydratase [Corynebacterium glutamicum ATCC 13032]8IDU_E Chain E, 3-dehydroquinate dehydratase [Corynebacterium glutamicum ATCC 13032]8IDU_F Chain F, 3-dehydroquinate dehydratase [Corynebacterium glutamicum ATCC 1303